jgi:hypothetical protein
MTIIYEIKENIEKILSKVVGLPVEITVRSEKEFTISFKSINKEAKERLLKYFEGYKVAVDEDMEHGTFIYLNF